MVYTECKIITFRGLSLFHLSSCNNFIPDTEQEFLTGLSLFTKMVFHLAEQSRTQLSDGKKFDGTSSLFVSVYLSHVNRTCQYTVMVQRKKPKTSTSRAGGDKSKFFRSFPSRYLMPLVSQNPQHLLPF